MSRAPRVSASADALLQRIAFLENPYFASLADGSMSLQKFRATQEQFYFAVRYYACPIAALVSRIPDPAQRLDLLHNIVEEHGDFREEHFHQNTFRKFLASINGVSPDLAGIPMGAAVHAFNSTLIGVCTHDEIEVGVCCLGIIERAFAEVSALIGKVVVERRWIGASHLVHYSLHAELDVRHAEDFFAIVESGWDDMRTRARLRQGLELGAYAFDQLYRGLLYKPESEEASSDKVP
jgi:pyrroloquinoline-quinone synthase